jgi:2,4-dienoyl-CoA reductase-like NADH-dependent reductase (Old Yellow Enzyme family)
MEAYGQMILANHDFLKRLKAKTPMNEANRTIFFAGTEKGHTDYPVVDELA